MAVPPCSDLTVVFARGSDQVLAAGTGHGGMAQAHFDHVATRLPGYSINRYELGTRDYGGHRYRAVGISAILDLSRTNIIRIIWSLIWRVSGQDASSSSSGSDLLEINRLGASELQALGSSQGVSECTSYLDRIEAPGALTMSATGRSILPERPWSSDGAMFLLGEGTRDPIAHVALFSDPTLHLPEGESPASSSISAG